MELKNIPNLCRRVLRFAQGILCGTRLTKKILWNREDFIKNTSLCLGLDRIILPPYAFVRFLSQFYEEMVACHERQKRARAECQKHKVKVEPRVPKSNFFNLHRFFSRGSYCIQCLHAKTCNRLRAIRHLSDAIPAADLPPWCVIEWLTREIPCWIFSGAFCW